MNRAKLQAFGGFLTAMVIPNMGAFIAWGFITALFIPTGWIPNEKFNELVSPMVTYLLPLLLAYSGGKLVHGERGAIAGTVATIGLIVGSDISMFLGAMIMGPLGAWCVKQFDKLIDGKIPAGFEMVVNNFSLGLIAMVLCLCSCAMIGPVIEYANQLVTNMITALVDFGFLPLLSVVNEPAKVLFLNNVIDQGVYYPLGMQQALEAGKSIFFMVASNPGAGLGLLLAFSIFGKGNSKKTAPGAIIIHFLGGIHEIYFPYVLMKPMMIFPMIVGSACGIITFQFFGAGLVAGPSPGSIFAYLALTPKGNFLGVIAGVLVATAVSFLLASFILKTSKETDDEKLEASMEKSKAMKQEGKDLLSDVMNKNNTVVDVNYIAFACDAGLGSSALGATAFKKRLQKAGIEKTVRNYAIEKVPAEADVIVTHESLLERARLKFPDRRIVTIQNFMNDPNLDALFEEIQKES